MVVTGDSQSNVHVWLSEDMKPYKKFDLGPSAKGVAVVGFSPCGRYIAAVGNDFVLSLFNVAYNKPIFSLSTGQDTVQNLKWSLKSKDLRFALITNRHI